MESQWKRIRAAGEDAQPEGSDGPPQSPGVQFGKLKGEKSVPFHTLSEDHLSPTDSPCGIGEAVVVVEEDCHLQSVPPSQLCDMAAGMEEDRLESLKTQRLEKEVKISMEKVNCCSVSAGEEAHIELQPCDEQLGTQLTSAETSQELDTQPAPAQSSSDVKDKDGEGVSAERNTKARRRHKVPTSAFLCLRTID
ncbi:hypothetical protein AAFF_G00108710 [Aldrovandia affinis]|uniref:Uncharacterized protein n=1 Tax=Aldrovandia affinis TaxID=143900 RepID=A0AAD7RTY9_9TELE|nr:hypothetical protein AAFF_G00108710 [Aldrovandia affinis]